MTFKFDHSHDFDVPVTEEFLEHCSGKFSSASMPPVNVSSVCVCARVCLAAMPVHLLIL